MTDKVPMDVSEIVHVVPGEGHHFLYLKSGFVVEFVPSTGAVTRTVRLPSMADVQAKLNAPATVRTGHFTL